MLEPELGGHFTHAYCTAGLCEVTLNGTRRDTLQRGINIVDGWKIAKW